MKRVKYVDAKGPAKVEVPVGASAVVVERGQEVDFPDEIADGLCERSDQWQPVKRGKKASAKTEEEGE